MKDGILIINKPRGITSHDAVDAVRRKLGMRRVGHAGTLDPLATGVLVILVGRSTRLFSTFSRCDKEYEAVLRLGLKTSSGDTDGAVLEERPFEGITGEMIEEAFRKYTGELLQTPPMVSAIKHKGKKLYELARKGIEVARAARKIKIEELRMLWYRPPDIGFLLACSSGTYVRTLAEDVAAELGTAGCICELTRTRVGPFELREAIRLEDVTEEAVLTERGTGCWKERYAG